MSKGLAGVNDAMFRELERLEAVDVSDRDQMEAEIGRAKAVRDIADTIISNGNLVLRVAQASTACGEAVAVPKGLLQ